MKEILYVPYKIVEGKRQPLNISTDISLVNQLLSSREIDGYLIGYEAPRLVKEKGDLVGLNIEELPWEEVEREFVRDGIRAFAYKVRTCRILQRAGFKTVGDVLNYFEGAVQRGYVGLDSYGWRSDDITREVFRRVGLELPRVRL